MRAETAREPTGHTVLRVVFNIINIRGGKMKNKLSPISAAMHDEIHRLTSAFAEQYELTSYQRDVAENLVYRVVSADRMEQERQREIVAREIIGGDKKS